MHDEPESDDAQRARQALASLRGTAPADPAFRARLRREFVAGSIAPVPGPAAADRDPAGVPRSMVSFPLPRRSARPAWGWVAVAAAAAVVVSAALLNPGPGWRVMTVSGTGIATVNGQAVPMTDRARLERALVPGVAVKLPADGALELASDGMLAIQMAGGTDAAVPRVPGRWFGREVEGRIAGGEWRITTGAGFRGARFAIVTPSAHVEITGTTLAVITDPKGTCVCVYEGHVLVGRDRKDMATVLAGRRRYVYADSAHMPLDDAMLPAERPALGDFCESMRPLLRRPR